MPAIRLLIRPLLEKGKHKYQLALITITSPKKKTNLMTNIPYDLVLRGVENMMQSHC
jgi:hypothetical protein